MALIAICLALLFISPAYYRLKAKGYGPARFIVPTILVSGASLAFAYVALLPGLAVTLLVPVALLALTFLLPPKKGAPGMAYLHIELTCPECNQPVSFPRAMEGRAALCPKCGELIEVPAESETAAPPHVTETAGDGDFVMLRQFLDPMQAEIARQRLQDEGIEAFLPDTATGAAYPSLQWASGGVRLLVPAADAAMAEEALDRPVEETSLPKDFIPPPAPIEPPVRGSRLTYALMTGVVFYLIFPFILVRLWVWFIPVLLPGPVQRGVIEDSLSLVEAFQITSAIALAFLIVAFFLEGGRRSGQQESDQPEER